MRIAVLGTRGFPDVPGGVEAHCQELYPRLVSLGCEVTVFTRRPYVRWPEKERTWRGITLVPLWCPKAASLEAISHTFMGTLRARRMHPDLLHIHAIGPALMVPAAKMLRLPVVMTHHGPDYEREKWGFLAKAALRGGESAGVKRSDAVIAISATIRDHIVRTYGRAATLIHNGVPRYPDVAAGPMIERLRIEPKRYVLTACRFVPEKGLHDLLGAYASLNDPPFKLVIAGDADHESAYSRSLKGLAARTPGIVLAGFVPRDGIHELLSNAGLFVLPSHYEGLPIALLEALSHRIPVLVSDIPAHAELHLSPRRYFRMGDESALSRGMLASIGKDLEDRERMEIEKALSGTYNWDRIAVATHEVYRTVLKLSSES